MKIILATPILAPEVGGPATYIKEIVERLGATHELTVVAYADNPEPLPGCQLVVVSKKQFLSLRLAKYFFVLLRAARGADVIYVQNAMASGLPAALVGMWLRIPVIIKFVGDEAWERASQLRQTSKQLEDFYKAPEGGFGTWLKMAIQGFVLRYVAMVTTPSAYLLELLITYYKVPRSRARVNYNATDDVPEVGGAENNKIDARNPHQIMTGVRLVPRKGVAGIIRATALLKEKFPDVHLVVAGDGPEQKSLEEITMSLGLVSNVEFLGRLSRDQVLDVQKRSAVQVLNSWYEGLPHGALESFATKTPIVATDVAGTNEAVYNEQTGLLVPINDDRALADAIERFFVDVSLRARMVEGGTKLLAEKFSWGAHLRTLEEMFATVTSK